MLLFKSLRPVRQDGTERAYTVQLKFFFLLATSGIHFVSTNMLTGIMLTKRFILLILGIVVAIVICISTSLFGMKTSYVPFGTEAWSLKPNANVVFVIDRHIDWKSMITKF